MSDLTQHSEWLSLIEVSGPFLAEPVLKDAFPQGLDGLDGAKKKLVRQAYDEWREAIDLDDPDALKIHKAWIELVLRRGLELDEDGSGDVLKRGADLADIKYERPEHGVTLTPDFAVVDGQGGPPLMLVTVYGPQVVLSEALRQGTWSASPGERLVELCRATGVRLGLVTNGEQWMFVDAPVGAVTTFASWYSRLWAQEPITLQAFVSLLGIRRFFVDRSEQLPALLDNSLKYQDEVTDALGEQVRRAVEVLIQALDRAHVDSNRTLLEGVEPAELYEAGLTVMMRIVFLLSAEERGLLLLGDELYEANYAVSTLRLQLRAESEEILERRWDAWSRLLSLFRAVYGGINHEALRLPALGGSLFDPDRFPFLEGRPRGSRWKVDMARPLPIDNRTVLLLLEAVQLFRGRTLSYMALDVEQIGYVYEGLLERTVVRASEVTLDLAATKSAENPWVTLPEIEDAAARGQDALQKLLKERTESSASRVRNDLNRPVDDAAAEKLLTACHADRGLRDRVKPYFHFLRTDPWGYPLVYPKGTFMVASGSDRRETGTHYTPKSFTEAIVKDTLEPVVYVGPSTNKPRTEWRLKSPKELLDLKVCDPAMGSGAFLVQVCRYLSERLTEAWAESENAGYAVTSEGEVVEELGTRDPLRVGETDRLTTARRLIAERCLYGVDMNPLAVELAKLSIWLITLAKGRPFGFLDHNLRCGDSLLGITSLEQIYFLEFAVNERSAKKLFASQIDYLVQRALGLRKELRSRSIRDVRDVEAMAALDEQARRELTLPSVIADVLVGETLAVHGRAGYTDLSIDVGAALTGNVEKVDALVKRASDSLRSDSIAIGKNRTPFHWPIEFPEVFARANGGFDAVVGNPPFLGGQKITGLLGTDYRDYLVRYVAAGKKGSADLVCYFFLRAYHIIRRSAALGFLAVNTIAQGDTREVGLDQIVSGGGVIRSATPNEKWPGHAAVVTSRVGLWKGDWYGLYFLGSKKVEHISNYLTDRVIWTPKKLKENSSLSYIGSIPLGDGFLLTQERAKALLMEDDRNSQILKPYLSGNDILSFPELTATRWVIDFGSMSLEDASCFESLFEIVKEKVKPVREKNNRKSRKEKWWQFAERSTALYDAIKDLDYVLFHSFTSKFVAFARVSSKQSFAGPHVVVASQDYAIFALLQSSIHEVWARAWCSTHETRLRYAPSDLLETFPFPSSDLSELRDLGESYNSLRASILKNNNIGLTQLYNHFHNPNIQDVPICELRELHIQIDRATARSFDWFDISPGLEFCENPEAPAADRFRFTFRSGLREDIINRLVALNKMRFEREAMTFQRISRRGVK